MNPCNRRLTRRTFLRSAGVALALPMLEPMVRHADAAAANSLNTHRRRFVAINHPLGLHAENFFPEQVGREYTPSPYLEPLKDLRDRFTVFSGVSHTEVDGGHSAEASFLTGAPHPGLPGFRNTISLDQLAAEQIGADTRHPFLALSAGGGSTLSWTRSGVRVPGEFLPSKLYARLFLDGSPQQVQKQIQNLRDGRSIMDAVDSQARLINKSLGKRDQEKLDEYFTSVRELEQRMALSQEWNKKPKPHVDYKQPVDVADKADIVAHMKHMYDLAFLAIQTDSTRLITFMGQGSNLVPPIPGVTIDHHQLSHHGKDPEKLAQLRILETEVTKLLAEFIGKLAAAKEDSATLLDRTIVLSGANMGNASSHNNTNLPILLAGGPFKHAGHLAFDKEKNKPLCNLLVAAAQSLGLPLEKFASSSGASLPGLEAVV